MLVDYGEAYFKSSLDSAIAAVQYECGMSSLHLACARGELGTVRNILGSINTSKGAINRPSDRGLARTALIEAAAGGHAGVVRLLVHSGADLEGVDRDGASALCIASFRGHRDSVRTLIEEGRPIFRP